MIGKIIAKVTMSTNPAVVHCTMYEFSSLVVLW